MTDILDLIDGALEDHTVSADAARWVPDDAARELANHPARWVTAAEVADGTAGSPYGAGEWTRQHAGGERIDWVTIPTDADQIPPTRTIEVSIAGFDGADRGFSWIDEHGARASACNEAHFVVRPGDGIFRPLPTGEARLGRSVDILAAATAWYGHQALARHAAVLEARAQRAEATWSPAWLEAIRLAFNHDELDELDFHAPQCPAHRDTGEPTDPMQRALWLRRNRNTGPKAKPRAPKRLDARGSR